MTKMEASVQNKSHRTGERGVALVIALLAMVVIAGLGFALMISSSTESMINASFRRAGLAHYAAMGGVEEMRGRMGPDATPVAADLTSVKIPCSTPATCPPLFNGSNAAVGGVPARSANLAVGYYIRINGTINPTNVACSYLGMNCYDPDAPAAPVYFTTTQPGTAMPYPWVKVQVATQRRLKRNLATPCNPSDPLDASYCDPATLNNDRMVCWNGLNMVVAEAFPLPDATVCGDPPNPVLIYTALSIQPGGAVRLVRELAALGMTPNLPGGLVLDGCPGIFPPPTSNPFSISGIDIGSLGDDAHAVTTRCAADAALIQTLIFDSNKCKPEVLTFPGCQNGPNHNPDYPGVGNNDCNGPNCVSTPESADIFYDPTLSNPAVNPFLADCAGLLALVQYVRNNAEYTYPAGTTNIPTPGNGNPTNNPDAWTRVINVIEGDATLSQADFGNPGAGIILIEGTVDLTGYPTYNGLILIIGEGVVNISGGGNGTVNGGILLANTTACSTTGMLGPISFNANGGGNFILNYNSDALIPADGTLPVRRLSLNY